jgi:hypothetical protein
MNILSAKEARQLTNEKIHESDNIIRFMKMVNEAVESKEYTFKYKVYDYDDDLSSSEYDYLVDVLDYKLEWNNPCQWYTVKF